MPGIEVNTIDDVTFEVTVDGPTRTTHTVTVAPDYCRKLTGGAVGAAELVRRSFEFLLEREPNTSILGTFDLALIVRYFPEYEDVIRERVS